MGPDKLMIYMSLSLEKASSNSYAFCQTMYCIFGNANNQNLLMNLKFSFGFFDGIKHIKKNPVKEIILYNDSLCQLSPLPIM